MNKLVYHVNCVHFFNRCSVQKQMGDYNNLLGSSRGHFCCPSGYINHNNCQDMQKGKTTEK